VYTGYVTEIGDVVTCPLFCKARREGKSRPPSDRTNLGNAVHAALDAYNCARIADQGNIEGATAAARATLVRVTPTLNPRPARGGDEIISAWPAHEQGTMGYIETLHSEVSAATVLNDRIGMVFPARPGTVEFALRMKIDVIRLIQEEGKVWAEVGDYKTGKMPADPFNMQAAAYRLFAERYRDKLAIPANAGIRVRFYTLSAPWGQCPTAAVNTWPAPGVPDDVDLGHLEDVFCAWATIAFQGPWPARPGPACSYCPSPCPTGMVGRGA